MFLKRKLAATIVGCAVAGAVAAPEVSFSGFLDADVVSWFDGSFDANQEFDLGTTIGFSEKVSAHFFTTVKSAFGVPAGGADAADRWLEVAFDGFDLTFESDFGTFAVGDLVFQYGKFNYYFYKRKSMITSESFTRGLSWSIGNDKITQTIMAGASDLNNSTGDLLGSTALALSDEMGLDVYYGIKSDFLLPFKDAGSAFAGVEFNGGFGDALSVKADVGLQIFGAGEKSVTVPLLLEPMLTLGSFSVALSAYYVVDPDETGMYMDAGEQFFTYVEPGISINDNFAVGLPLEIHSAGPAKDMADAGAFWAVPTVYIYPFEGTQWWIWYGLTAPFAKGADLVHGFGSEIIVEF